MELKIEYIAVGKLKPYEKNTRKHETKDVDNIAKSIEKYGMCDAIGIWGDENIIVEGHGRLMACKKLGIDKVPCVRLDHLTDEERREYAIAHNATAELSVWDKDFLAEELGELDLSEFDFDFDFGIDTDAEEETEIVEDEENPYTMNVNAPIYEITGEKPSILELVEDTKTNELIDKIQNSKVDNDIKEFLIKSAQRHLKFDYKKIAEYYANADKEVQKLFEDSALVIIDFKSAIKNGFTKLSKRIEEMRDEE